MLTQCPHCQTIFRVTQEVLTFADGQVRCGRCGAPFDGIKGFVDHHQLLAARRSSSSSKGSSTPAGGTPAITAATSAESAATRPIHNEPAKFSLKQPAATPPPAAKEALRDTESKSTAPETIAPRFVAPAAAPTPAPADSAAAPLAPSPPPELTKSPAPPPTASPKVVVPAEATASTKAAVTDDRPKDATNDPAKDLAKDLAKDSAKDLAKDLDSDLTKDLEQVLRRPKKLGWGAWKFIAPPLLLLLGVQIVHYFRQDIANSPRFGPPLITLYTELGLYLEPHWRLKAYEVRQWGVLANPSKPGTLRVRASITNRAAFAQPYPLLRLVLEDRFGQQVQAREFEPGEYTEGQFDGKARLSPNERVDANLTIVDPGAQAEGFRFDVCLRQPSGVFCADDEAPVL